MTTKTVLALAAAAFALTTSLSTGAEARGFGGFGGRMGGGSMFRSAPMMKMAPMKMAPMKMKAFKQAPSFKSHVMKSKPAFVKRDVVKHKIANQVIKKHGLKPAGFKHLAKPKLDLKKTHLTKNIDKLKANKLFAHKLQANKLLKADKLSQPKLALHHAPKSLKMLAPAQLQKAMPFDAKGNKFSAAKKAWWDGKHWWKGALAWTFIGGAWYYGDELWYEEDGVWRTESGFLAECLDCEPVVVGRTRVASLDAKPAYSDPSQPRQARSGTSPSTASSGAAKSVHKDADKPVKSAADDGKTKTTTEMSTEAVLIKSATSPAVEQTSELPLEPTTAAEAGEAAQGVKVAEASADVEPASAGSAMSEPTASPMLDCKRFVPTVSMTISVPCGK